MAAWGSAIACFLLAAVCLTTTMATIFPDDDLGYRHYAKKEISSDCLRCVRTYNYVPCLRCWNRKYAVIPFHSKRSSAVAETGSDVISRDRRYTGCNCCISSRFANIHCCNVCFTTTKRMGKRDSDTSGDVSLVEKRMNPDCFCCANNNNQQCCNECIQSYVYY